MPDGGGGAAHPKTSSRGTCSYGLSLSRVGRSHDPWGAKLFRSLRCVFFALVVLVLAAHSPLDAVGQEVTQKGDQTRQRQQEVDEELKLARASDAGVEAEVARLTRAVASQQATADQARQAQVAAQVAAEEAARKLATLEARSVQAKAELARRAVEAYSHPSKGGGFFALTQSASFDDAVRRQSYFTVVQGRTVDAIGALRAAREDQADARTEMDKASNLAAERARAEKDQADALLSARRTQQAARDQLQGRISSLEQESRQLAAQEAQIQALIRAQAAPPAAAAQAAPSSPGDTLPTPGATSPAASGPTPPGAAVRPSGSKFIWPIGGVVTSEYGPRWGSFHPGIDIAGPDGAPIAAARKGVVIYAAFNDGGYGNYVIIDHQDGFVTAYAHQSRLAVRQGQSVSQGQVIGYEGSTGFSTGPHLHFEVRLNGSAQDPRNYVSGDP